MKFAIELSEAQLDIIKTALEEYFRLRMNQTWEFADNICFEGFDYGNHNDEEFNERIEQREMFRNSLEILLNAVHPLQLGAGKTREKTVEMLRAMDIWGVIRHELWVCKHGDGDTWCVDSRKPMRMSDELLPVMREIKDDKS